MSRFKKNDYISQANWPVVYQVMQIERDPVTHLIVYRLKVVGPRTSDMEKLYLCLKDKIYYQGNNQLRNYFVLPNYRPFNKKSHNHPLTKIFA